MLLDHNYDMCLIISNERALHWAAQPTEIDGLILGAVGVLESSDFYFF